MRDDSFSVDQKEREPYEWEHKYGRPTKYHPEVCAQFIEEMGKGFTVKSAAVGIGISLDTIYSWRKKYPEFSEAFEIAKLCSQRKWEQLLIDKAEGKNRKLDTNLIKFALGTRFDEFREKQEVTHEAGKSVTLKYSLETDGKGTT